MTTRTAPKPRTAAAGKVDFDLDALDVQPDLPFVVKLNGQRVRLRNIRDLDWQVSARLSPQRPFDFFEQVVLEEDQEAFLKAHLTDKQLGFIFEAYAEHFDLDTRQGESGA